MTGGCQSPLPPLDVVHAPAHQEDVCFHPVGGAAVLNKPTALPGMSCQQPTSKRKQTCDRNCMYILVHSNLKFVQSVKQV